MPIVNPLLIYLIMSINSICFALSLIGVIFITVGMITAHIIGNNGEVDKTKGFKRALRKAYIGIAIIILSFLVPSKETIVMIAASKYITVENVQIGKEVVEKVYNDILEVIKTK